MIGIRVTKVRHVPVPNSPYKQYEAVCDVEFYYISAEDFVALHHEWYTVEYAPGRLHWFEAIPKLSDDELVHWYHQLPKNALWMGLHSFSDLSAALGLSDGYFTTHDSVIHPSKLPKKKVTLIRHYEGYTKIPNKKNKPIPNFGEARVDCYILADFPTNLLHKWDQARRVQKITRLLGE